MRIVVKKQWQVYLDFWRAGSLSLQLYWTYHRLLHIKWHWIVILYLFMRKIKLPHYYASLKQQYPLISPNIIAIFFCSSENKRSLGFWAWEGRTQLNLLTNVFYSSLINKLGRTHCTYLGLSCFDFQNKYCIVYRKIFYFYLNKQLKQMKCQ